MLALCDQLPEHEHLIELFRRGAQLELDALQASPDGVEMWLVDLYGNDRWMVGAGHGAAGILQPLLRGLRLLPDDVAGRVLSVARALVARTALRDGERANWLPTIDSDGSDIRVQWCHGAPGMVIALAPAAVDDDATREMLVAGGELIWHAGPLAKGAGLCHGTAGNALALLQLFDLTGDELWLDRARRFAMHALTQVRARREQVGRGRHSLMTGDLGVAVALVQCEQARPGIPGLHFL